MGATMLLTRRGLVVGLVGFVAAPAIVRASSIMPVRGWEDIIEHPFRQTQITDASLYDALSVHLYGST